MPLSRRAFVGCFLMLPGWQGRVIQAHPPDTGGPLADDGSTSPMYSAVHSPAFYDAGLNRTFVAWEAWNGGRAQQVTALDHSTGYFSDIEGMGRSFLVDDEHGNPTIVLDHENHLHCFYGAHGNLTPEPKGMKHSSTRWPWGGAELGGSKWAQRADIAGEFTYPHAVMAGSGLHLFMRGYISATADYPLVLYKTSALADGVATWGAEQTIVDFGADSRVYQGQAILVGTDIHFVVTKSPGVDSIRQHVYYFRYDTATGALTNHDGSFSTASGSLPVDLTSANSNYRIFTHSGSNGCYVPVLAFDTNGDPFVAFSDGTGTSLDIKVMKRSSGTWGSPETAANTDLRFNDYALGPLPGGEMELFWTADPGAAWGDNGDIMRKVRSAAGVWGSAETILAATTRSLGQLNVVRNAHANARVTFCENAPNALDATAAAAQGRVYLWGAQGLVAYRQAPAAGAVGTAADGNELREDDSIELREDDANELREVPD